MIRVFPRLDNVKLMDLFHKGVAAQWSASEVDWNLPLQLDRLERKALAQVLTPVYLGEQTAMVGAGSVIPKFFQAHETEAQLYLSTFLMDEARHFEIITRFYNELGERPLEVRDLKDMLRYHMRLYKSKDRVEWLWGILLSDILAKHFYGGLVQANPGSLFAQIAGRILRDEARHLAFTELYLKTAVEHDPELKPRFLQMRDDLLFLIQSGLGSLKDQAGLVGLDSQDLCGGVSLDLEKKGQRLGLTGPVSDVVVPD